MAASLVYFMAAWAVGYVIGFKVRMVRMAFRAA